MEDNPCRYCVPPVRYPGCQDICPRGATWKAAHEAQMAEAFRPQFGGTFYYFYFLVNGLQTY